MLDKLEAEIYAILEQSSKEHCGFSAVNWFLREMAWHFSTEYLQTVRPDVIVLGEDIPQELVWACSRNPLFVLGGSLETTHWSDALVPRDADPISRSALGWLLNDEFNLTKNALVVMALSSDNRRKMAGLLRRKGIRVAAADMPPYFSEESSLDAWTSEMLLLAKEISVHTRVRLTSHRLNGAIQEKQQMQRAAGNFKSALMNAPDCMSPMLREMILESGWYTGNRREWANHLRQLTGQVIAWNRSYYRQPDTRPWVLLAGSPVVFPNEKLPVLLEASGLYLAARADAVALQADMPCVAGRTVDSILRQMSKSRLPHEASGAWISNDGLLSAVHNLLEKLPIDGIVYHVLKGQVEYDFELPNIERIAAEYGMPVIRLETDYQQQDVEQLRIRLEAFSEMLRQRSLEGMRLAL